jgi:Fe-Mn family superoxide dismutase
MATYTLPELRYDYSALEPYISGKIMELHHDKHHAGYVKGANAALERLAETRARDQFDDIGALEKALAFNLSGHVLHSVFWNNMAPKAGGRPQGELGAAINQEFGGFERLQKQINAVAASIMGSGWAALVWEPLGKKLLVTQIYDHQSNLAQAGTPLLVLDAWEHAFYLQYQNRKAEYFDAVWNVWNWKDVAERFEDARRVDVALAGVRTGGG